MFRGDIIIVFLFTSNSEICSSQNKKIEKKKRKNLLLKRSFPRIYVNTTFNQ